MKDQEVLTMSSDLFDVLKRRRACRRFLAKPVPADVLDKIAYAAHRAPTGGNIPYRFVIVVRDPEKKSALSRAARNQKSVAEADTVIVAIGQVIAADLAGRFKRTQKGFISVDKGFRTSVPGVFAGGDAVSGEGTIVQSVAHGKDAAHAIDKYLRER